VQSKVADHQVRVALPSAYGPWLQGTPGISRAIGRALAAATLDELAHLRATIEAAGVPCDAWCVPRSAADGAFHGAVAALFDRFYLNTEWGWAGFWTERAPAAIRAYLGAFWGALEAAGRADLHVGWTLVPNSMLAGSTDAELATWAAGCHETALEVYLPGDPSLDPHTGLAKWRARAGRIGVDQPATVMVEHGDLLGYLAALSHPEHGAHLWTLASTAAYFAGAWLDKKAAVVSVLGWIRGDVVAGRRASPERAQVLALADALERETGALL
jgi:hypothetical protein